MVNLPTDLADEANRLMRDHPNTFISLGRPFAWDMPDSTAEEQEADRAELADALAIREIEYQGWLIRRRWHEQKVRAWLDSQMEYDLFGGVA